MKNFLKFSAISLLVVSCSTPTTPTPQKLSQNLQAVPPSTVISVISQDNYQLPHDAQIIEKTGVFKTRDNIYDKQGNQVLIPKDAIVVGTYSNDGVNCKVIWKSIYVNGEEYENKRGTFALGSQAQPSICSPERGIKKHDRLTIRINDNSMD